MRRARRKQSDAALREAQSKERLGLNQQPQNSQDPAQDGPDGPRWDPLTGERTTRPHGRPSQVKPAEFVHGLGVTGQTSSPPQKTVVAPVSFGDRVRRMAKMGGPKDAEEDPAAGAFAATRPGWRGASGRTAIVDPVKDDPEVAPLKVPDRSSRRVVSPTSASAPKPSFVGAFLRRGQTPPVSPGVETSAEAAPRDTVRKVVPSSQLSPIEPRQNPQGGQQFPSSPVTPNTPSAPERAAQELTRDVLTSISANSSNSPSIGASPQGKSPSIRRKPAANAGHQPQESVSSVYSHQSEMPPPPPIHNPHASTLPPNDPWVQPASRFSVTTYATSADGTPRESLDDFAHNHPPMPNMPSGFKESPKAKQESVMDRRRPKLDAGYDDGVRSTHASPIVISLKDEFASSPYRYGNESQASRDRKAAATGAYANPAVTRARTTAERPTSSSSSINKMLPPVPPETSAGEARDRVGLLNAQLQALANRRININRSITQMTELMPTDNVLNSMDVIRKREGEKRKVEGLKQELAEVQREEYELGLKLHRAYKRLDRDDNWEPTTLWVRRVTG